MKENTKEKQIHANHRNRMKNIFVENGLDAFSEIQKLEFLLFFSIPQKDVNPLAHTLLDEFGSLQGVLDADFDSLLKISGVGKQTALLLKTFDAVAKEKPAANSTLRLGNTTLAKEYCYNLLKKATIEEFYVICMDETHKVLKTKKINAGSANRVNITISEITKLCFSCNATEIIISHNHPSGNDKFSDDDLTLTHNIMCNCLLNDIRLIDHILVTPTKTFSLANQGVISTIEANVVKHMNVSPTMKQRISAPYAKYLTNKNDD